MLIYSEEANIFFCCNQKPSLSRSWIISFLRNDWSQNVTKPASVYWLIVNSLFQVPDKFWVRSPENIWGLRVNVYFSRVKIWTTYFCSLLWFDFISSMKQVGHKQPPALPGRGNKRAEQKTLSEIEDQVGGSRKDQNNKLPLQSDSLR